MDNIDKRLKIFNDSKERMKKLRFGDAVTNICASRENPMRHCYFVERKAHNAKCTDKNGSFWDIDIKVIYPGHLEDEKCQELFHPVWESQFGKG